MSIYNGNRFSVFTSEEKTALGLIKELGDLTNINIENIENIGNSNNKKVSYDELHNKYKLSPYADFTGTWHGLSKPTLSEEGMRATVELLEKKLIGYSNVKQFGAIGDGVSDDTIAIQQALDNVNSGGGMVYFPKGVYKISGTLKVTAHGVKIQGECPQSTYIKMVGNGVPALELFNKDKILSGCLIVDISLFYSNENRSTNYGISLKKQVNLQMSNVIVEGFKVGVYCSYVGNSYIEHVGVVSGVDGAIGFQVGDKSVSSYFISCYVGFSNYAVDNGIGFLANEGNIADINIEYLDIGNGGYGVLIDGSQAPTDYPPTDINIKNVIVDGCRISAIQIVNINNRGSVNVIGGWINPLAINNSKCFNIQNSSNISINNVTMQQLANTAPNVYGVVGYKSDCISIKDCNILNLLSFISFNETTNNKIDGNTIKIYTGLTAQSYCINLEGCNKNSITNNLLDGDYLKGIYVHGGNNTIITNNLIAWSKVSVETDSVNKIVEHNL